MASLSVCKNKIINKYFKKKYQNKIDSKLHSQKKSIDIRLLTFKPKKQSVTSRWIYPDDTVFNDLAEHVNEEDKLKISEFLNLYYYFIICYSKTCYKRTANWHDNYRYYISNGKRYKHFNSSFNYDLSNETQSHKVILKIQSDMIKLRKMYDIDDILRCKFWYSTMITFIMEFVNQSLYDLCNVISDPVRLVCNDIKTKMEKYKTLKPYKKSNKYDINALIKVIGPINPLELNTSNMIEICLGVSYMHQEA